MRNIRITQIEQHSAAQQPVEIVERKGLGHPDTICDLLVESISVNLAQRVPGAVRSGAAL